MVRFAFVLARSLGGFSAARRRAARVFRRTLEEYGLPPRAARELASAFGKTPRKELLGMSGFQR